MTYNWQIGLGFEKAQYGSTMKVPMPPLCISPATKYSSPYRTQKFLKIKTSTQNRIRGGYI